jgi:hypothetical protein
MWMNEERKKTNVNVCKINNISMNGDRIISLYDYLEKLQFINYRRQNQHAHKQLLSSIGTGKI